MFASLPACLPACYCYAVAKAAMQAPMGDLWDESARLGLQDGSFTEIKSVRKRSREILPRSTRVFATAVSFRHHHHHGRRRRRRPFSP